MKKPLPNSPLPHYDQAVTLEQLAAQQKVAPIARRGQLADNVLRADETSADLNLFINDLRLNGNPKE